VCLPFGRCTIQLSLFRRLNDVEELTPIPGNNVSPVTQVSVRKDPYALKSIGLTRIYPRFAG